MEEPGSASPSSRTSDELASARKTLSIVSTVYYSADSLLPLFAELQQLEQDLAAHDMALELIFVDDGSGDASFGELMKIKAARPATKVIKHARNFGAVAAAKTGFKFVTGDCFIILASDLQDPPAQILKMVEHWRRGAKFVISVRAQRVDPPLTRMTAAIFYFLLDRFVMPGYPRGGFDLMLMDKDLLPFMVASANHVNPTVYAYWLGFTPTVLEYVRRERKFGRSRWTFLKKLNYFIDTITGFSVAPIRFFSLLGCVIALLSFLYGLDIIIGTFLGFINVQGFATLVTLISFFSGMIMIMLGVIGEYLWRIFDATTRKPESVIDEIHI